MRSIATLVLAASLSSFAATAQTTITNGGFENWGNASPGLSTEPTGWYSDQSGSSTASLGGQTCFQESGIKHSGSYCVKVVTISGPFSTVVNGVVTTGVVNAPSINKTDGYIGTVNYSSATDDRRMSFTGRPDSLVGWYQYTPGGAGEQGKIRAILHTGDYYDPETPTTYHPNPTANKIADLTFTTPSSTVSTWTRFSMPFNYVSGSSPTYIMINVTPSTNQATTITGSTMYIDDLQTVYAPLGVNKTVMTEDDVNVYSYYKTVCVNFAGGNDDRSALTIFDISGKKVFSTTVLNDQFNTFNLSDLNTGIYIYQLSSNDFRKTGKLFIQ